MLPSRPRSRLARDRIERIDVDDVIGRIRVIHPVAPRRECQAIGDEHAVSDHSERKVGIETAELAVRIVTRLPDRAAPKAAPGIDPPVIETAARRVRGIVRDLARHAPLFIQKEDAGAHRRDEAATLTQPETSDVLGHAEVAVRAGSRIETVDAGRQDVGEVERPFPGGPYWAFS